MTWRAIPSANRWRRSSPQHLGLAPEQVLLTNGVDEAIHLLCEAYLEPQDEVIVVTPTFSMYEIFAEATGARVMRVQCDGRLPVSDRKVLRQHHAGHPTDRGGQPEQSDRWRCTRASSCWRSPTPRPTRRCWWTKPTSTFMGKQ